MLSLLALERIAVSVRPSFEPITRVGVLSFANSRSCLMSDGIQGFPVFLVYFGISGFSSSFSRCVLLLLAGNPLACRFWRLSFATFLLYRALRCLLHLRQHLREFKTE